jgi:predicted ester cyclase
MAPEQNKEIVRRQFELLDAGDVKGAAALWAEESYNHGRKVNPRQLESVYADLDLLHERHSIHEMVAEGEWVAVRTTCEGVHAAKVQVNSGIFAVLEPTGRKYTAQHMHLFRVVDGKLTEHWANRDDLGAARQVGLELRPANE